MTAAGAPARRLLCITHVVPLPSRAGNEYRIHRLLAWLVADGWDVRLVVCPAVPPSPDQLAALAMAPYAAEVCPHDGQVDGLAERLGEGEPADAAEARVLDFLRGFCPDPLVERVAQIDAEWQPHVLLAEYLFLTRCFPVLRRDVVKVVDTIDVFSAKAGKVEAHGVSDGYALTVEEEGALLAPADLVVAIQPDEAIVLAALAPDAVVVSAGVDVQADPLPSPPSAGAPVVLLVASANPMNRAGLHGFLTEAWPQVRVPVPDAVLRVVGPIGERLDLAALPAGVDVAGRVDDLAREYAGARLVVNPAAAGTGVKVKTVEGVAHGRRVVTWPAGVDGLPPSLLAGCDVVSDWPAFAAAVADGLRAPAAFDHAAVAAALAPAAVYGRLGATLRAMTDHRASGAVPGRERAAAGRASLRVLSLFVQHGRVAYPDALPALHRLMAARLPGVAHDVLVVDNARRRPPVRWPWRPRTIAGSNEWWEFSAWDDGVAAVGDDLDGYDAVVLVTSAFEQYDAHRHLDLLGPSVVEQVRDERVVVGHVDRFDEPVWVDGAALQQWVRSSLVLLAPAELRRLGSLVSVRPDAAWWTTDPAEPFAAGAPLSANYRAYLRGWITGAGTGQGVEWHSRFDLTPATLPRFRAKATAILNEQLLTHRLRVQGCEVVDLARFAG